MSRHMLFVSMISLAFLALACSEKHIEVLEGGRAKGKVLTVDSSGEAGQYVKLDLDSQNMAHLVYYDKKNQALRYAKQTVAGFTIETIDEKCPRCPYVTIRMSPTGEPQVAYYSETAQMLLFAYKKDGKWQSEPIEWGSNTGMGVQLLLDESQKLHAVYYSGDGFLKHAWRILRKDAADLPALVAVNKNKPPKPTGKGGPEPVPTEGIWDVETIDRANGSEQVLISFLRDPKGRFVVSYLHWSGLNSELKLASRNDSGAWSVETIARENNPGKSSTLIYAAGGQPLIIFREARKDRLVLGEQASHGWVTLSLVDDAYNMALVKDSNANLLVGFEEFSGSDPRKGVLKMVWRKSSEWTSYSVDSTPGSGTSLDVAITSTGKARLAYYVESDHRLKLFEEE